MNVQHDNSEVPDTARHRHYGGNISIYGIYIYTVYIDMSIYSRIVYQKQKTKRQDKDIREILENRSGRHTTAADAVSKSWEIHATIETNILKRKKGTALKLNNRTTKI